MDNVKGLTGLANLGNTCYLNATMQILAHTKLFNNLLDTINKKQLKNSNKNELIFEWDNLRQLMWDKNCTINPQRWVSCVKEFAKCKNNGLFLSDEQNDISEFLLFLFESFHDTLKKKVKIEVTGNVKTTQDRLAVKCYNMLKLQYKNDYSEIFNIFYGIKYVEIKDLNDKSLSVNPDLFLFLDLNIPKKKKVSLYDCLDLYFQEEYLTGDNQYYYEKNKAKIDAKKKLNIWSFPEVLIIIIQRFEINYKTQNISKNNSNIGIEIEHLDLNKYVKGYNNANNIYSLYGVCNYIGNINCGHYTATIKNNDNWYNYDDETISLLNNNNIITNKAYCLFYQKN